MRSIIVAKESPIRLFCVCRLLANGYNISTMAPNKGYSSLVKTAITGSADPMSGEHGLQIVQSLCCNQLMLRWPLSLSNLPQLTFFPAVHRNRLRYSALLCKIEMSCVGLQEAMLHTEL